MDVICFCFFLERIFEYFVLFFPIIVTVNLVEHSTISLYHWNLGFFEYILSTISSCVPSPRSAALLALLHQLRRVTHGYGTKDDEEFKLLQVGQGHRYHRFVCQLFLWGIDPSSKKIKETWIYNIIQHDIYI